MTTEQLFYRQYAGQAMHLAPIYTSSK